MKPSPLFNPSTFFEFVQPQYLYAAAFVFLAITTILVSFIYLFLFQKKKKARTKEKISEILDEWISNAILSGEDEQHVYVNSELLDYFQEPENRSFATQQLINSKKNLLGMAAGNIIRIYEQLDLHKESMYKLKSRLWQVRTKGIYELYVMEQYQAAERISKMTNDKNEFVRTEAQTAAIRFAGFGGLDFLNDLTEPLTDWQQVKILDQLTSRDAESMPGLEAWLQSAIPDVVLFALRLSESFQQLQVHDTVATIAGGNPNDKIRNQAIRTLAAIGGSSTPKLLTTLYDKETEVNREVILKNLTKIASPAELNFLSERMDEENDSIRLHAARIAWRIGEEGKLLVKHKADTDPGHFGKIYAHVKSEVLK